jgi:uncharacterized protein (DUF3820 family)
MRTETTHGQYNLPNLMSRIEPREPAYTDEDLMPFGKYQGKSLETVPASYLLWLWDEGSNSNTRLDNYIFNSLSVLMDGCLDRIVSRKS